MKPNQWNYPRSGINQIPIEFTILGDVMLKLFYNCANVLDKLEEYVDDIIINIEKLKFRGPI